MNHLTLREQAMFKDIAGVMANYPELADQFGLMRAHSHFPLSSGEVLLEQSDPEKRTSRVKPVMGSKLSSRAKPTQYLLDKNGNATVFLWCCD